MDRTGGADRRPVAFVTCNGYNATVALSNAERQRLFRERRRAAVPLQRPKRPPRPRPRPARWAAAVQVLRTIQDEYQEWRDQMPGSLAGSRTAELLDEVCGINLDPLEEVDLPRGFGRD